SSPTRRCGSSTRHGAGEPPGGLSRGRHRRRRRAAHVLHFRHLPTLRDRRRGLASGATPDRFPAFQPLPRERDPIRSVSREIASDATPLRIPRAPRLEQPPALVLGTGITALGVVRALGRAGLPLHAASADAGFVRASRWYRPPPAGRGLADPTL